MENKKHIPSYLIGSLIVVAIQIAGFALLWDKIATQQEYIYLPATVSEGTTGAQTAAPIIIGRPPDEKLFRDMIQSVLKEELASYKHQLVENRPGQKNIPPHSDVKENSPANIRAFNEATTTVETALAAGTWTQEDNMKMMQQAQQLTPAQKMRILNDIANAINRQELHPQTLPLF
jgi:hypothetical protein